MVYCSLKTLDKLKEVEERERQIEGERATNKVAATTF